MFVCLFVCEMKSRTFLVFCLTALFSLVIIISDSRFSIQDLTFETIIRDFASGSRDEDSEPQEHVTNLPGDKSGFQDSESITRDENSGSWAKKFETLIRNVTSRDETLGSRQRRIYISMGLCWHHHTKLYHKVHFPYEEAAR